MTLFRMRHAIMLTAICVTAPDLSVAEEELPAELLRCSRIDDSSARLTCYDAFTGRESPVAPKSSGAPIPTSAPKPSGAPNPSSAPKPSSAANPPTAPPPADTPSESQPEKSLDDIDAETRPGAYSKKVEELTVRGTVTQCGKDAYKKYLFYFENGQVWKQVGSKRLYFKECSFGVTITQDIFGYKMQPDGKKGQIRISRIK